MQQKYKITGSVKTKNGNPISKATVRIYGIGIRKKKLLNRVATDADGNFSSSFEAVSKADLEIIVLKGREIIVPAVEKHNAKKSFNIDLIKGGVKPTEDITEFIRLKEKSAPLLDGLKLGELNSAEKTKLSKKLGKPAQVIDNLQAAEKLSDETNISQEFAYALINAGLPADPNALAMQPEKIIRRAVKKAVSDKLVSENILDESDKLIESLYKYSADKYLSSEGDKTALGGALKISTLKTSEKKKFLSALHLHSGTSGDLWGKIKDSSGLSGKSINNVKESIELSHFSGFNLQMTKAMKKRMGQKADISKLAELDSADWEKIIKENNIMIPSSIEGSTPAIKKKNYAKSITNKFEYAYSGKRITAKLITKNGNNDIGKFFKKHGDFDIAKTPVHKYIAENRSKLENEVNDVLALESNLKKNQRLFNLAPLNGKAEIMENLDKAGISSAVNIAKGKTKKVFIKEYSKSLGGKENALKVFNKASNTAAKIQAALGALVATAPGNAPAVVSSTVEANSSTIDIPDFETLFGSQSYCECEHCKSVLSPAAYMVDLLEFLRNSDVNDAGNTPLDLLFERRPDIGNIELSCENTNTALPYIDLVIEILENAVLVHNGETVDNNYQTSGTTEELHAFPENINPLAYNILETSVYPFNLPYNFNNTEGDAYITKLDISRFEIMQTIQFQSGANEPSDSDKAVANLGLSANLKELIIGNREIDSTSYSVKSLWGESASSWMTSLSYVDNFLDKTGLTYKELQQLLQVEFVNPDGDIVIDFSEADDPCDISQARIRKADGTALTQSFFEKIHRFFRLHNKLNWGIPELGYTLKAIGNNTLNETFIEKLSTVKFLHESLKIDIVELLCWWSELNTAKDESEENSKSYYEKLFLNKSVMNPVEPVFELNSSGNALAIEELSSAEFISDHTTPIAAALGISAQDLNIFLEIIDNDNLTLSNLSKLHRFSSAAKAFDISSKELAILINLISDNPFDEGDPTGSFYFSEKIESIKAGSLSIKELSYLFMHDYDEADKITISENSISKSLNILLDGLQKILAENYYESDPTGEITASKLALILDEDIYLELIAIIIEQSSLSDAEQEDLIENYLTFVDASEAKTALLSVNENVTLETRIQARYNYLFEPLLNYIIQIQSSEFVAQSAADEFDLDLDTSLLLISELALSADDSSKNAVEEFLDDTFVNYEFEESEISYDLFPAQFDTWLLLHKAAKIVSASELTNDELIWVYENSSAVGWPDLNSLPTKYSDGGNELFSQWINMSEMCRLNSNYRTEDASFLSLLDMVVNGTESDTVPTIEDFAELYHELSGWELSDINFLLGSSAYNLTLEDFSNTEVLVQIETCLKMAKYVGTTSETIWMWTAADLNDNLSANIRQTVKSHYGNEQWLTIAPNLRDSLRQQQRNALSSYLIGNAGYEDEMDLFDHYLIDTEMQSCMLTSRIKQANSSLQLFIQRSFMGLEEEITLDYDQKQQWEWMAQYRIWEANRMVFLFAENWLEPELRTSKSEFFEALENELLQDQINDENVERAITRYIEKVDSVSWLEILGTYHYTATIDEEDIDVLHVVGRTKSHPHTYYYRKFEKSAWTPWEKLDIEVDSEFVMPIVINGRLLLFWAKLRETAKEATRLYNDLPEYLIEVFELYLENKLHWILEQRSDNSLTDSDIDDHLESISDPFVYYDIKIGMSEYKYDKWTPGKMSKESFTVGNGELMILAYLCGGMDPTDMSKIHFYIDQYSNTVKINCYFHAVGSIPLSGDDFTIDSDLSSEEIHYDLSTGTFNFEGADNWDNYKLPNSSIEYEKFKISRGYDFELYKDADNNSVTVLDSQDFSIEIPIPAQYPEYYSQSKLFYQDEKRSYLLTPKKTAGALPWMSMQFKSKTKPTNNADFNKDILVEQLMQTKYKFENFFHPYSNDFMKTLNLYGLDEVMRRDTQLWESEYFDNYGPKAVLEPYPKNEIDFTYGSSYGVYNWELFYHVPMLIANKLNQDQQFEEAQKWYHYIFNPLDRTGNTYDTPQHYWQLKPFFEEYDLDSINDLMYALSYTGTDNEMRQKKELVEAQIEAWEADPFEPHTIAALRKVAYMKNTVLKYIDNLIDWGDSLFKRDTIESLNEATQLYILAYKLMGNRPEEIPADDREVYTYNELLENGIDSFSNALVEIESLLISGEEFETEASSVNAALYNLYFCIPHNEQLITYWDKIEDRLFKIRNCMNIEGVKRSLALFEPSIDPGMLVNAKAAGIDLGSVLSDLNAPLPNYRFQFYIAKAKEYARDIQGLGRSLLSALEKKDAEALALLRSNQEMSLQSSIKELKKLYIDEAQENLSALQQSKSIVELRYNYFRDIVKINGGEAAQLILSGMSGVSQLVSQIIRLTAAVTTNIPDTTVGAAGIMPVAIVSMPGGSSISSSMQKTSDAFQTAAGILNTAASITGTLASYQRRWNDWKLQEKLAKSEMEQIDKQIAAAEIRVKMMEKDLSNFEKQMQQSAEYHEFMIGKYTNKELYQWMISQLSSLYFQAYSLAYDCAKRTQKNFQYELSSDQTFVQYGYWDSLKKGLLAGEKLLHSLKRMEMAYYEQNKRQMEISKQISLAMFDPLSLQMLQQNGECYIELPESMFDIDYPGHYLRRLKTVSITLPSVIGPYTSINGTLTLLENKYRKNTNTSGGYAEISGNEDERFIYNQAAIQSVATSSGINDSGLFQINFQDEKYLPFEGAGAVSRWRFSLPDKFRPFDYATISDLIIHLNYTAKNGGESFKTEVNDSIMDSIINMTLGSGNTGLNRAFSCKHDFPNDWYLFLNPSEGENHKITLNLAKERFPFMFNSYSIYISQVDIYVLTSGSAPELSVTTNDTTGGTNLTAVSDMENVLTGTVYIDPDASSLTKLTGTTGDWLIESDSIDSEGIADMIIIYHYGISE